MRLEFGVALVDCPGLYMFGFDCGEHCGFIGFLLILGSCDGVLALFSRPYVHSFTITVREFVGAAVVTVRPLFGFVVMLLQ